MSDPVTLTDSAALSDLMTFLGRAAQVQDSSVRLIAHGSTLAVYVPILLPSGLLDDSATVLGLRVLERVPGGDIDTVVPLASLRARVTVAADAAAVEFGLPAAVYSVAWAGIAPPRGGWREVETDITTSDLAEVAERGIARVAAALPSDPGTHVVEAVRHEVWQDTLPGAEVLPTGAAFAAATLGFLEGDVEAARVFELGTWTRLSTERGHVLVRRAAWSLAR